MVQVVGLEPTRPCGPRILSPLRIPFRHTCDWAQAKDFGGQRQGFEEVDKSGVSRGRRRGGIGVFASQHVAFLAAGIEKPAEPAGRAAFEKIKSAEQQGHKPQRRLRINQKRRREQTKPRRPAPKR